MVDVLIGADPEVFVFNKKSKTFVSADGMVDGTKENPLAVTDGAVQVDGMALEFNINPASSKEEFVKNIASVQAALHKMIGADQFDLVPNPSVVFTDEIWNATPEEAKVLGCEPDFNAWYGGQENPAPNANLQMRTGAGHIHFGFTQGADINDEDHQLACVAITKQMDASLGLQSLLWDNDKDRRVLYGNAGAMRYKSYGVEYRVLSNAWLQDKKLTEHVYSVGHKAITDLQKGVRYTEMFDDPEEIKNIIDNNLTSEARLYAGELNRRYGVPLLEAA